MIPVLNWEDYDKAPKDFAHALGKACRETGFFLLSGHGVDPDLITRVFSASDQFFALPEAEKAALDMRNNPHNRGWVAFGAERLDDKSGQPDQKEAFNIGLDLAADDPRVLANEPFRGVNIWPDLPGFSETLLEYYDAVLQVGLNLHRAVAQDLGLDPQYFAPHFEVPMAFLRLLHYPAGQHGIGAGAHTDYGSITLLLTDGEPGLQVRPRGGDWMDVPDIKGAFVVNIGDALMRWSNDIYVSTPHRVLPPKHERRSIAFFMEPSPETLIAALPGTGAPNYPPIRMGDYLRARLDATHDRTET